MFRATKIVGYIKAMERYGIDARTLLAGTQIAEDKVSSKECLISLEQYHSVVANMIRLTGNPGIAFDLGHQATLNDLGIVGYAMISANSLRNALEIWFRYSSSLVGNPLRMITFYDAAPGFEVEISSSSRIGLLHRFETEEFLVQGSRVIQDLIGVAPVFGGISFTYSSPAHRALYERYLNCPLEFDAKRIVIRILAPDLDAPIRTMNEELFSICAEHCRRVMTSISETGQFDDKLRDRLRSLFLASPDKLPSLEEAGAILGMSVSTLCRHLDERGQSYQSIKDEFRYDLAREYLRLGHMTPKQVAYLLGFASPSTFSRAFKVWAGQTVGEFLHSNLPANNGLNSGAKISSFRGAKRDGAR